MRSPEFIQEVKNAMEVLHAGGIILYPTDTIWGIGCDATNADAVRKIYTLKKRDPNKSLIVLLDQPGRLESYVKNVPGNAWDLIEYSEKPLTIIYDHGRNVAEGVMADDGTLAVRITKDEFCCALISKLRKPLVSTSANISGQNFPGSFHQVADEILHGVDYVVNLRQEEKATKIPSTIVRLSDNGIIRFIR